MGRRSAVGLIAAGLVIVILIGGLLAYRLISSQVNLAGILASGEEGQVQVPEGFKVEVYAEGLDAPRFIHFGPEGKLFVAERGADRIVSLEDKDGDGRSDLLQVFADEVANPHSITFYDGDWYVGVPNGVIRLTDHDGDGQADERIALIDNYPTSGHNTRTVEFLPDGRMLVSVGSSCNICEEEDPRRAAVVAYENANAEGEYLYASGLRNAVGLTLHPSTGELWATDNGRDRMGDDLPPETVYIIREGADYGWPRCHSGRIVDPDYGYEELATRWKPQSSRCKLIRLPSGWSFMQATPSLSLIEMTFSSPSMVPGIAVSRRVIRSLGCLSKEPCRVRRS